MNNFKLLALAVMALAFVPALGGQSTVVSNTVQIALIATVPEAATVACDPMTWPETEDAVTVSCIASFNTQEGRSSRAFSLISTDNSTPRSVLTPAIDRW
jgi:hypothetical protein